MDIPDGASVFICIKNICLYIPEFVNMKIKSSHEDDKHYSMFILCPLKDVMKTLKYQTQYTMYT